MQIRMPKIYQRGELMQSRLVAYAAAIAAAAITAGSALGYARSQMPPELAQPVQEATTTATPTPKATQTPISDYNRPITRKEDFPSRSFVRLRNMERSQKGITDYALGLPWIRDGMTEEEENFLDGMLTMYNRNPEQARAYLEARSQAPQPCNSAQGNPIVCSYDNSMKLAGSPAVTQTVANMIDFSKRFPGVYEYIQGYADYIIEDNSLLPKLNYLATNSPGSNTIYIMPTTVFSGEARNDRNYIIGVGILDHESAFIESHKSNPNLGNKERFEYVVNHQLETVQKMGGPSDLIERLKLNIDDCNSGQIPYCRQ